MDTMNRCQRKYLLAKARVEAIEATRDRLEKEYIASRKITNGDGKAPAHIWTMDDTEAFEKANAEFSSLTKGLEREMYVAQNALWKAEGRLAAYGLAIVPADAYQMLKTVVERDWEMRHKFLELTLRLDASIAPTKVWWGGLPACSCESQG